MQHVLKKCSDGQDENEDPSIGEVWVWNWNFQCLYTTSDSLGFPKFYTHSKDSGGDDDDDDDDGDEGDDDSIDTDALDDDIANDQWNKSVQSGILNFRTRT